ncbi:Synaptic vesicle glycoprotein 2B, partial [Trichoplax sp. H2]
MTIENQFDEREDGEETALISDIDENAGSDCTIDSNDLMSSIDDIVENIDVGLFHYLVVLSCGLCYGGYNVYFQAMGYIIISACDLDINISNRGWLSLSMMIGMTLSVGVLGRLADAYGRRKILLFSMTINLIAMLLSAFAYNYNMLVILAAIIGCSNAGLIATIFNYLMEFFPRQYRGIAGACIISFLIFESLLSSTVALFTLPHPFYKIGGIYFSSWRLYLLIVTTPTLLGYCILLFLPDSLRFTLAKSERKKAEL